MQPRSKLIETDRCNGGEREGAPRLKFDHGPSPVPGFSMTSVVSIMRPDVSAFATRFASRRMGIHHDGELSDREGIWCNLAETYVRHREFLLADGGALD